MRNIVVLAALAISLAGCMTPQQQAAADDRSCADMGAPRGSGLYFQCRVLKQQQQAQRQENISNSLEAMSAMYNRPAATRLQTTCTSSRIGIYVQTDCD